ncbi:MAG: dTMP kinase [Pseudomonadota bacterium]
MKHGFFVAIEGGDGSGKSTLIKGLRPLLEALGLAICQTREPGGSALGMRIRHMLLEEHETLSPEPLSELLLLLSARHQHLETLIRPALRAGKLVLCDRFQASTMAYQGAGHGICQQLIVQLSESILGHDRPDLTLILHLDGKTGLERVSARAPANSYERFDLAFHQRVSNAFASMAREDQSGRTVLLDARLARHDLARKAYRLICDHMARAGFGPEITAKAGS